MSPSGSRMQTDGTSTVASPFWRLASRSSAAGEKTEAAAGDLFSRRGHADLVRRFGLRGILTAFRNHRGPRGYRSGNQKGIVRSSSGLGRGPTQAYRRKLDLGLFSRASGANRPIRDVRCWGLKRTRYAQPEFFRV